MQPLFNDRSSGFVTLKTARERKKEILCKVMGSEEVVRICAKRDSTTNSGTIRINYSEGSREKVIAFMQEKGVLSQNCLNQYCYKEVPIEFIAGAPPCKISYEIAIKRVPEIGSKLLELPEVTSVASQIDLRTKSGIICVSSKKNDREKVITFMQEQGFLSKNASSQYCYKEVPIEFEEYTASTSRHC